MSTTIENAFQQELEASVNAMYILIIVIIIVMLFVTGVFIANAFFFSEIRKSGCGSKISTTEGDIMFWFNLILAIISGIIVIFGIFILVFSKSRPEFIERYVGSYVPGTVPVYTYKGAKYGYQHPETVSEQIEQVRAFETIERELKAQIAAEQAAQLAEI